MDQLKQLGSEVLGNGTSQRDADKEEEVLNGEQLSVKLRARAVWTETETNRYAT